MVNRIPAVADVVVVVVELRKDCSTDRHYSVLLPEEPLNPSEQLDTAAAIGGNSWNQT